MAVQISRYISSTVWTSALTTLIPTSQYRSVLSPWPTIIYNTVVLDGAGEIQLFLTEDDVESNHVPIIIRRATPPSEIGLDHTTIQPNSEVIISGSSIGTADGGLTVSPTPRYIVTLEAAGNVVETIVPSSVSEDEIRFVGPYVPLPGGGTMSGQYQVCVSADHRKLCANQMLTLLPLDTSTSSGTGSATQTYLAQLQQALPSSVGATPAQLKAISLATKLISDLSAQVGAVSSNGTANLNVFTPTGLQTTSLDQDALRSFEALLGNAGQPSPTVSRAASTAQLVAAATAPTAPCGPEADLLNAATAYQVNDNFGNAFKTLENSKVAQVSMCFVDLNTGGSASKVFDALKTIQAVVSLVGNLSPIFLTSLRINPSEVALNPGGTTQFRVTGIFGEQSATLLADLTDKSIHGIAKKLLEDTPEIKELQNSFSALSIDTSSACKSLIPPALDPASYAAGKFDDFLDQLVNLLLNEPDFNDLISSLYNDLFGPNPVQVSVPLTSASVGISNSNASGATVNWSGSCGYSGQVTLNTNSGPNPISITAYPLLLPESGLLNFSGVYGFLIADGAQPSATLTIDISGTNPSSNKIVLNASANGVAIQPGIQATVQVGQGKTATVVLDASASTLSPGSVISWYSNDQLQGQSSKLTLQLPSGQYHLEARSPSVTSQSVDLAVVAPLGPLAGFTMVGLASPGNPVGTPVSNGSTLTVSAPQNGQVGVSLVSKSTPSNGTSLTSYIWQADGNNIGSSATAQPFFAVGDHNISLRVTDNLGNSSQASGVVHVTPLGSPTALFDFDWNGLSGTSTSTVNWTVSPGGSANVRFRGDRSSSPAGIISAYSWTNNGLPAGTDRDIVLPLGKGSYVIGLAVSDGVGGHATTTANLTISEGLQPSLSTITTAPNAPLQAQPFSFTIVGTNFDPSSAQVLFTGAGCSPCVVPNGALTTKTASQIVGPETLYGSGGFSVTVQNALGGATSNGASITVGGTGSSNPTVSSVSISPSTIAAGASGIVTVTLSGGAPTGGAVVSLSASSGVSVPSSFTIPAGLSSGTSTIQASTTVTSTTSMTVTATYNNSSKSTSVTVAVPPPTISVSPLSLAPAFTIGDSAASLGFTVANTAAGALSGTMAASTTTGGNWLTIGNSTSTSSSWSAPQTLTVTANPSGLAAGTYVGSLLITAVGATNSPITIPVSMSIYSALKITTTALPDANAGANYSCQLQASGGSGSGFTWTLGDGPLPGGLTLSSSGLISGTVAATSSVSTTSLGFSVQDSAGHFATTHISITWRPGLAISDLYIPSQPVVGSPNPGFAVQATGGTPPYTWSATGLPPGLTLAASTGTVTGTPTQAGTFQTVFTVTDSANKTAQRTLPITVTVATLSVTDSTGHTPPSVPSGTTGVAYNQYLQASGGSQAGYTWGIVQGGLPNGLTSTPTVTQSCTGCALVISGTPTQAGTFTFTLKLTDTLNNSVQQSVTIVINSGTPPQITSPVGLTLGTIGQAYSYTFAATGGAGGYQWSIVGNKPDASLNLSSAGVLSGTSTVPNDCVEGVNAFVPPAYSSIYFTVKVTDSANQSATKNFCVPSFYPQPQITAASPTSVTLDGAQHTITVSGTNFRSNATLYLYNSSVPMTYVSSTAVSLVVYPYQGVGAWSPNPPGGSQVQFPTGSFPVKILQPYSLVSNSDKTFAIYNPTPVVTSVSAVALNTQNPCRVNASCQLIVNGSGFMSDTDFLIKETNADLNSALSHPSTPEPWNTADTGAFSVSAAGQYTVHITNTNTAGGTTSVEAKFTVIN